MQERTTPYIYITQAAIQLLGRKRSSVELSGVSRRSMRGGDNQYKEGGWDWGKEEALDGREKLLIKACTFDTS